MTTTRNSLLAKLCGGCSAAMLAVALSFGGPAAVRAEAPDVLTLSLQEEPIVVQMTTADETPLNLIEESTPPSDENSASTEQAASSEEGSAPSEQAIASEEMSAPVEQAATSEEQIPSASDVAQTEPEVEQTGSLNTDLQQSAGGALMALPETESATTAVETPEAE